MFSSVVVVLVLCVSMPNLHIVGPKVSISYEGLEYVVYASV